MKVKPQTWPAVTITRAALHHNRLVYIAKANKRITYQHGKSRIAYIGTTKNGVYRIANSAAWKAQSLLNEHGIWQLEFFVVTCSGYKAVKTWRKLERALLIRFRERLGSVPSGNNQGQN